MEAWMVGGIAGGIGGGIAALIAVRRLNARLRTLPCPQCGATLGDKKPGPRTSTQILWGGWTCPECGSDVDRHGNLRTT
jgi:predicted RNA-binding Zn-ribbon protein involved in translation (DUF1610 family)